ncbi:MAG: N-acetylmuramoyl-L-alanine amidase [Clostridia bacterium]|nr:N-acetylmuramoyl-L-alanine amidase [Clostridia bacterium]
MVKEYRQLSYNVSPRTSAIAYLVIHDTGNTAKGADAKAHFTYFQGGNRGSSADIFVDDTSVWYVNDYTKYSSWHCGDGKGKYGITNQNSIGIELCINQDSDFSKTLENAVQVVKELMKELQIPPRRVVRHYDASRKCCPKSLSQNNWKGWYDFYAKLCKEDVTMDKPVYNRIDDVPPWAKDAVCWAVEKGLVQGDGTGLSLTEDKLWTLVVLYRLVQLPLN